MHGQKFFFGHPNRTKLKRFFKHFNILMNKKCKSVSTKRYVSMLKVEAQTRNIHVFINDDDEVCVPQQQTYHHRKMKEEKKNFQTTLKIMAR